MTVLALTATCLLAFASGGLASTGCVGRWTSWTPCSAACGGGQRTRTFRVITQPNSREPPCQIDDGQVQAFPCNTEPCASTGPQELCAKDCGPKISFVCGNDGETYRNHCELKKAANCGDKPNKALQKAFRGPCAGMLIEDGLVCSHGKGKDFFKKAPMTVDECQAECETRATPCATWTYIGKALPVCHTFGECTRWKNMNQGDKEYVSGMNYNAVIQPKP